MRTLRALLSGVALLAGAASAEPAEYVYRVDQHVRIEGAGVLRQTVLSGVRLETVSDGTLLRTRVLWSAQRGGGHSSSTSRLDPDDADDRAMIDVLSSGFELPLARDGAAGPLRPADPEAWRRLADANPRVSALLENQEQLTGLRPLALPARLRVGQTLVDRADVPEFGRVTRHLQVREVTDDAAVLEIRLQGDGVQAEGRQVVRRGNGLPIEARLRLTTDARDGAPAATQRVHMVAVAEEPVLSTLQAEDDAGDGAYEALRDTLSAPPFSALSDHASDYMLHPDPPDALEYWMLDANALPAIEAELLFMLQPDHHAARPAITLAAQLGRTGPRADDRRRDPEVVVARLHDADLIDRAGHALPDVTAIPVKRQLVMAGTYRVDEGEADFPLRLPIGTDASQLEALDRIRLQVAVETWAPGGIERVARGAQSQRNALGRIEWTLPRRITLAAPPRDIHADAGIWSFPVPLDAAGREIPAARLLVPWAMSETHAAGDRPLPWELDRSPPRIELATREPIASVELRHYRWTMTPRTWTFRNAQDLIDAGDVPQSSNAAPPDQRVEPGAATVARTVHPREAHAPPACAPDATTRASTTPCVAGGYAARPGLAWSSPIRVP